MKSNNITRQTAFRFRRWSRHRYAVFCSIGHYVNIGRLSNRIADASTNKIKKNSSHIILHASREEETSSKEFADTSPIPELTKCLITLPVLSSETCRGGKRHRYITYPTLLPDKELRRTSDGALLTSPAATYHSITCINTSPRCSDFFYALPPLQMRSRLIHASATAGRNSHNYTIHIPKISLYDNQFIRCRSSVASLYLGITPVADIHGKTCRGRIYRTRRG